MKLYMAIQPTGKCLFGNGFAVKPPDHGSLYHQWSARWPNTREGWLALTSVAVEPLVRELQRLSVLGDGANHVVRHAVRYGGLDLQRDLHLRPDKAEVTSSNLVGRAMRSRAYWDEFAGAPFLATP
jgi:hypothetical protein